MRVAWILALAVALLPSCTSLVPATVTWGPSEPISDERTIFLTARSQRVEIERSLRDADFVVANTRPEGYVLRVDIGRNRGSQPCGTLNNVSYILSRGSTRILVIKGRGLTGSCTPNILADMSRMMQSYFGG